MKKLLAILLVLSTVLCFAACGPTTTDPSKTSINVCLASEPQTLDPALNSAVDGATMCAHLFSGLAKWAQDKDGKLVIVPDLVTELVEGVVDEATGKVTYTYTLKDGLKWSNGDALTAADFVNSWNRAADDAFGADYGYMFEVVDGYADIYATTDKLDENGNVVLDEETGEPVQVPLYPDAKLNVTAKDEKTIEVVLANAVAYWNELLAFPTYYPVHSSAFDNDEWATDPSTYINNGPYTMKSWEPSVG